MRVLTLAAAHVFATSLAHAAEWKEEDNADPRWEVCLHGTVGAGRAAD
jgi:hypothetical protein